MWRKTSLLKSGDYGRGCGKRKKARTAEGTEDHGGKATGQGLNTMRWFCLSQLTLLLVLSFPRLPCLSIHWTRTRLHIPDIPHIRILRRGRRSAPEDACRVRG